MNRRSFFSSLVGSSAAAAAVVPAVAQFKPLPHQLHLSGADYLDYRPYLLAAGARRTLGSYVVRWSGYKTDPFSDRFRARWVAVPLYLRSGSTLLPYLYVDSGGHEGPCEDDMVFQGGSGSEGITIHSSDRHRYKVQERSYSQMKSLVNGYAWDHYYGLDVDHRYKWREFLPEPRRAVRLIRALGQDPIVQQLQK